MREREREGGLVSNMPGAKNAHWLQERTVRNGDTRGGDKLTGGPAARVRSRAPSPPSRGGNGSANKNRREREKVEEILPSSAETALSGLRTAQDPLARPPCDPLTRHLLHRPPAAGGRPSTPGRVERGARLNADAPPDGLSRASRPRAAPTARPSPVVGRGYTMARGKGETPGGAPDIPWGRDMPLVAGDPPGLSGAQACE